MNYLRRDVDVAPGDRVVTSGLDGIFPKGVVIGEIADVSLEHRGLLRSGVVIPSVDLDELEEVLIVDATVQLDERCGLMRTAIVVALVACVGLLLQSTAFQLLPFEHAVPDVLLVVNVYLGLHFHTVGGVAGAFLLGYVQDSASGSPAGLNACGMLVGFCACVPHLPSPVGGQSGFEGGVGVFGVARQDNRGRQLAGGCSSSSAVLVAHLPVGSAVARGARGRWWRRRYSGFLPIAEFDRIAKRSDGCRCSVPRSIRAARAAACMFGSAVAFALLLLLLGRLWVLQVLRGEEMAALSENNRIRLRRIAATRGRVVDRRGRVLVDSERRSTRCWCRRTRRTSRTPSRRWRNFLQQSAAETQACSNRPPDARLSRRSWSSAISTGRRCGRSRRTRLDLPGVSVRITPQRHYREGRDPGARARLRRRGHA